MRCVFGEKWSVSFKRFKVGCVALVKMAAVNAGLVILLCTPINALFNYQVNCWRRALPRNRDHMRRAAVLGRSADGGGDGSGGSADSGAGGQPHQHGGRAPPPVPRPRPR